MPIDAILLDWGGTLASIDGEAQALRRGAARALELLVGESTPELIESMAAAAVEAERQAAAHPEHREVNLRTLIRTWARGNHLPIDDTRLDSAMDLIGRHWIGAALTVLPGARETLQLLRGRGLRLGLVSNCFMPVEYCLAELRHQELGDLLDSATFSSGVGFRKPSSLIYQAAARTMIAGPIDYARILFVGDSPAYDVIGPARMGMKTALITDGSVRWPAADYDQARPDYRITSVRELPALLAGGR